VRAVVSAAHAPEEREPRPGLAYNRRVLLLLAADVNAFDHELLQFLNCDFTSPWFARLLRLMQDKWIAVPFFLVVLVALSFLDWRRCVRALAAAALGWGVSMLIASVLWVTLERPRPPWVYENVVQSAYATPEAVAGCATVPDTVVVRRHKSGSPGFPSRHAMTAGVFAMVLTLAWWWVGAGAWVFALLVAAGRVHDGVHWPTDVMAGLLLGALMGWAAWRVVPRILGRIGLGKLVAASASQGDSNGEPGPPAPVG